MIRRGNIASGKPGGGGERRWRSFVLAALAISIPASFQTAKYQVSAWTFGDRTSLNRAAASSAIDEVNLDWYLSKANGDLFTGDENMDFVAAARSRGLRVLATVSNYSVTLDDFDADLAHGILMSTKLRNRHVAAIYQLCLKKGYDGIDLDWESLYRSDRNRFTNFVRQLSQKLHGGGKLLSIAVHPKTSEPGDWSGAQAQDYRQLGVVVDEFKVMTYDYSGSWSDPGPISPPSWADEVLTFAESAVLPAKIMMGLPFYGYDWKGQDVTAVSWADVQAIIDTYDPPLRRDVSGELTFSYTDDAGKKHVVFFQDRAAIAAKLRMLIRKHAALRGVAIWVMGGESPGFWKEIFKQLR